MGHGLPCREDQVQEDQGEERETRKEEDEGSEQVGKKRTRNHSGEGTPSKKVKRNNIVKKGKLFLLSTNHPQEQDSTYKKKTKSGKGSGQYDMKCPQQQLV